MHVFVTGGNGFLGSRTVHELIRKGHRVRCLLRKQSDVRRIRSLPYEAVYGDIRDSESLKIATRGCDAVVHLAGVSSWEQIRKQAEALDEIIVGGTSNVLDAAIENDVSRVVVISTSAAVNGSKRPRVFNEKSRYELSKSDLKYSVSKNKMETLVKSYVKKTGLDVVTVNPCEVYGPDDVEMITAGNLVEFLKNSPALVCEGGTAVAHVDDVAKGIVLALEKGRKGERYILGGENLTITQMAKIVRKVGKKSDQVVTLPNVVVTHLCKAMARLGLNPPLAMDVLDYATMYWFMDSSKAAKELGFKARSAEDTFRDVVGWLIDTKRVAPQTSIRYGGSQLDLRTSMIRIFAALQRKKVVILDSDPRLCGEILAASDKKGNFLEYLIATPAWHPVYSIESMDGQRWEQLSRDFKKLMGQIKWRERLGDLIQREAQNLFEKVEADAAAVVDSEALARLVVRVFFELLFEKPMSSDEETLFYQASIEWRKEIAVKGEAKSKVKSEFWSKLTDVVAASKFGDGLERYKDDPSCWLSLFAQPFLISPQINIGDIFVTVNRCLRYDLSQFERAREWAKNGDKARLAGVVQEAIRLRHPFPILERELKKDIEVNGVKYSAGTQFFILLDQFKQDQNFNPERWLEAAGENPYHAIPFAAGPRMCIGKPIAMEMMVDLLGIFLLKFPEEKLKFEQGHLYSGRSNDGEVSAEESRYQVQVFAKALWRSFLIGQFGSDSESNTGCPWKATTSLLQRTKLMFKF